MLSYTRTLRVAAALREMLQYRGGQSWGQIAAELGSMLGFKLSGRTVQSVAAAIGLDRGQRAAPSSADRAVAAMGERFAAEQAARLEAERQLGDVVRELRDRVAKLEGKPVERPADGELAANWSPARGWSSGRVGSKRGY